MKRITILLSLLITFLCSNAAITAGPSARTILDRTAAALSAKGGAMANFKATGAKTGTTSGTIKVKANKFQATIPNAIVWYDGTTQWAYMKSTNEVTVSKPSADKRMSMNPYTFITFYKQGYNMSATKKGASYVVHLTAKGKKAIQEMYITVNASSYVPSTIKVKQNNSWTTITISHFRAVNLPNSTFTFRAKDYPTAEVIDLR